MTALDWRFDNSYARLPQDFFARLEPTRVRAPQLVIFNHRLAQELGLQPEGANPPPAADVFAGNALPEGAAPLAQAYAGHQFGHFTMLGDGRAIMLREHVAPDGRRFDIQLKGSGPTPFSRRGDGRAALGPMLREYLVSEAMAGLGIPTTRSLAVASTGETVYREEPQPGAVLTRVAASHLRVGTFQYAAARRNVDDLRKLLDYAIQRHDPDLAGAENAALALLRRVCERQADLIVDWMRVGFVHGVMNTDNMAISGETIDYGPCAFIDSYDPQTTFSSIDSAGRYAFGAQPAVAQWNLTRFAETLLPLIAPEQDTAIALAEEEIYRFGELYTTRWRDMMRRKLGLAGAEPDDAQLIDDLLDWMRDRRADYVNTFRALITQDIAADDAAFAEWASRWRARQTRGDGDPQAARRMIAQANPAYIPRNHKVEEALEAAVEHDDLAPLRRLLDIVSRPYEARDGLDAFTQPDPAGPGCYRTFCGT